MSANPNLGREPVRAGTPLEAAQRAVVLVHGRDQDEHVMLDVIERLALEDTAFLLPVAAERTWYHGRYYDPVADNEPHLGWALATVEHALTQATEAGIAPRRVLLGGFSQGACLTAELIARRPRPLGGVAVLTGSLLGPRGATRTVHDVSRLPMYVSCSRYDQWVAPADARATADVFAAAGADVTFEELDDREHMISDRAVAGLRRLLDRA